eukprot:TRINITY_DN42525_c0_g1_i1.p1 TRINITY_DN42525_c0_g1~~TRINITY_DN42525_c0_g1_i1.p1  ORF type:complete len:174 (-),score=23.91 TRINITY_DN42525_c0_g1_i1:305-826(-)
MAASIELCKAILLAVASLFLPPVCRNLSVIVGCFHLAACIQELLTQRTSCISTGEKCTKREDCTYMKENARLMAAAICITIALSIYMSQIDWSSYTEGTASLKQILQVTCGLLVRASISFALVKFVEEFRTRSSKAESAEEEHKCDCQRLHRCCYDKACPYSEAYWAELSALD